MGWKDLQSEVAELFSAMEYENQGGSHVQGFWLRRTVGKRAKQSDEERKAARRARDRARRAAGRVGPKVSYKLSEADKEAIRTSLLPTSEVARLFGVCISTVKRYRKHRVRKVTYNPQAKRRDKKQRAEWMRQLRLRKKQQSGSP